jgi:hypothetical protein
VRKEKEKEKEIGKTLTDIGNRNGGKEGKA